MYNLNTDSLTEPEAFKLRVLVCINDFQYMALPGAEGSTYDESKHAARSEYVEELLADGASEEDAENLEEIEDQGYLLAEYLQNTLRYQPSLLGITGFEPGVDRGRNTINLELVGDITDDTAHAQIVYFGKTDEFLFPLCFKDQATPTSPSPVVSATKFLQDAFRGHADLDNVLSTSKVLDTRITADDFTSVFNTLESSQSSPTPDFINTITALMGEEAEIPSLRFVTTNPHRSPVRNSFQEITPGGIVDLMEGISEVIAIPRPGGGVVDLVIVNDAQDVNILLRLDEGAGTVEVISIG